MKRQSIPSFFFCPDADISLAQIGKLTNEKYIDHMILYPYGTENKKENSISIKISDRLYSDIESAIPDKSVLLLNNTFEQTLNGILVNEHKILAIYFTNKEKVDLGYKLLTSNEELKKNVVFTVYIDPPQRLIGSFGITPRDLPRVGGLIPGTTMDKNGQYQHPAFLYPNPSAPYLELVEFFKSLVNRAQNKTGGEEPTNIRKRKGPIEIVQLNNTRDLKERCIHRATICFIGLLEADFSTKGLKKLEEQIKILNTVWAKKESAPMEIMWVNASCHKEVLKQFGLEEMAVPTVALYAPKKKLGGNMIGKFDQENVFDYIEGAFIGKTGGLHSINKDVEISEIDCSNIKPAESESLSPEEKKALEEIIKEEEAKKQKLREEAGYKTKKKTKKDL